ncbi:MAG: hypothetical protein PHP65_00460 [Bacilli bacterium]|nr:hypothetical protein [Bacilli bacterium]
MSIDNYIKVDLHIHSAASKTKTGDETKTKTGIFKNIDVLFKRMNNSGVNVFSFTDHNTFDYDLYSKTRTYIESSEFPYTNIKKILPGVEFDLKFGDNNIRTHAICVFKDDNNDKIKNIESIIKEVLNGRDISTVRFDEDDLSTIMRKICLDFIIIVHQKSDILCETVHGDNDFSCINDEKKDLLIYYDYFTLYESNQHLFRFRFEQFKIQKGMQANFITGTDCHTWEKYPDVIENPNSFDFSYIKSDLSFDGLKIAVTGNGERRILNAIPSSKEIVVDEIKISVDGIPISIPMSDGINAIIGGNTSGKSLLIAEIFDQLEIDKKPQSFIKKWNIDYTSSQVPKGKIEYISQGTIRKLFEQDGANLIAQFKQIYQQINYAEYNEILVKNKDRLFSLINRNSKQNDLFKSIDCTINIPNYEDKTYYPQITPLPSRPTNPSKNLVNKFEKMVEIMNEVVNVVEPQHADLMKDLISKTTELVQYYGRKSAKEKEKILIFESFISGVNDYKMFVEEYGVSISDKELLQYDEIVTTYLSNLNQLLNVNLTHYDDFISSIEEFDIDPIIEEHNELKYVTIPKVARYDKNCILDILFSPMNIDTKDYHNRKYIMDLNLDEVLKKLKNNNKEVINNLNYKQKYETMFMEEINKSYCADTYKILDKNEEVQNIKSPGHNAIYFIKTKAGLLHNKLIVFDQPEDDVAPEKIRTDLIRSISKMAITNQVIIVTHNPQLVVNLDVDNVICLDVSENKYKILFGPLYEKKNCNMLQVIANKLEGGKDALKERWKRYEEKY